MIALNLLMRGIFASRAMTEPDPAAWVDDFTKRLIASMHAAPVGQDLIDDKIASFAEAALLTLAKNVKLRLKEGSTT